MHKTTVGKDREWVKDTMIYFDNAAATPLSEKALEAMMPFLNENFANPHGMYSCAKKAGRAVTEARDLVASLIGALPEEIFFTSGGTESDNLAVFGAVRNTRKRKIITTKIEHPAVLNCFKALEKEGFDVVYLSPDSDGIIRPETLKKVVTRDTALVSVMTANNETGVIQPVKELCRVAHAVDALFHTDAVQAVGNVRFNVNDFVPDIVSFSAHKMHGPKGVGALYIRHGITLTPYMHGGAQESGVRPGTLNVPGIAGFGAAANEAAKRLENGEETKVAKLRDYLLSGIERAVPEAILNGSRSKRLPGNINISLPGADSATMLIMLDAAGICASGGSACGNIKGEPSHVLSAMGLEEKRINGALRLTLSHLNTLEEADRFIGEFSKMAEMFRRNGLI